MGNHKKTAFTLIELLVVIAIIALLLAILMPALSAVKKRAQAVVCLSNLKQWGSVFTLYSSDNRDYFPQNYAGGGLSHYEAYWCHATMKYYNDEDLRFCPSTKLSTENVAASKNATSPVISYGTTFEQWGPLIDVDLIPPGSTPNSWADEFPQGSYGMNEWCSSPNGGNWAGVSDQDPKWWRRTSRVRQAHKVPMFMDMKMVDAYPKAATGGYVSPPPWYPDEPSSYSDYNSNSMKVMCMDRHSKGINITFVDASASKVRLKKLWTLKWNPMYDTHNKWTGENVTWPDWLMKM